MNNKYIILTAMYRYGILYLENEPSREQIKHTLTTTNPHTVIPGSKLLVKKSLSDNYVIRNQKDLEQVISELMNEIWQDCVIYNGLIDIYLNGSETFKDMSREQAEKYLSGEEKLKRYVNAFSPAWKEFGLIEDLNHHLDTFKTRLLDYFNPENLYFRGQLSVLFEKNRRWLPSIGNFSMAGFQLSQVISIISDSNICHYLEDEETSSLLDIYGAFTEILFPDWSTFLFSAIFGRQLMSAVGGAFILDWENYGKNCYQLASHPGRLLEISGVWENSDMSDFCRIISKEYGFSQEEGEKLPEDSDLRFTYVQNMVKPVLEKYGVEYLLDQEICDLEYTVPVLDKESGAYFDMETLSKKKWFGLSSEEIPFMANSKMIITSHGIKCTEKKLLKKKLHTFRWNEKLEFTYRFTPLDYISFMVNGVHVFHMPRNYKKAGVSKKEDVFLDKQKVLQYYSEDIGNVLRAFKQLAEVLGKNQ